MDDLTRFYAYYIIYPILGVGFVALAAARLPRGRMRVPVVLLAAAIAIGALFLEHLVAKAEFDTLCRKSAGGKIIATVDAPPEEFGARFGIAHADAPFPSAWNNITAHSVTLIDSSTNTLLAEYRRLTAPNRLPPLLSDSRYGPCPTEIEEKAFIESLRNVFKRAAP